VLDRAGRWLATLLALSANSPFWQGLDSSYASFRYQVWGRWPCSGPTGPFATAQAYRQTLRQMVATGTLTDPGKVYFNARLDGALLNPVTGQPEQAATVVHMLLDHCRNALADAGDTDAVAELMAAVLAQGNGASFQRAAYRHSGRLSDVIRDAAEVTEAG